MTPAQAAEMLNIKLGTLRSMVFHKSIPHIKVGPRTVRFRIKDLEAWVAAREEGRAPAPQADNILKVWGEQ